MELGDFLFSHSIEFHGIPWYIPWKSRVAWHWIKWQSQSSMEFHGTKWYFIWRHQTSMEYSMEFHGTCVIWNGAVLIPWNHKDLGDFLMIFYLATPEIPGITWNIPWKSIVTGHKMTIWKFHGIPWNLVILHLAATKFHGIPWNVPWNSMELSDMSFGGTRVPWNSMEYSMEFHGTNWYFIWRHQSSMEYSMEFHGTNWYFIWRHQSSMDYSMELHGISVLFVMAPS